MKRPPGQAGPPRRGALDFAVRELARRHRLTLEAARALLGDTLEVVCEATRRYGRCQVQEVGYFATRRRAAKRMLLNGREHRIPERVVVTFTEARR